ncbi:MAG: tail fiber domain-containing protein [Acidobacteriota bacterium]
MRARIVILLLFATAGFALAGEVARQPRTRLPVLSIPVAEIVSGPQRVDWVPRLAHERLVLTVARPDGRVFRQELAAGANPSFALVEPDGSACPDGSYTWELTAAPVLDEQSRRELLARRQADDSPASLEGGETGTARGRVQSGTFTVQGGAIVAPDAVETAAPVGQASAQGIVVRPLDVVHADDTIVTGSLCVGFDCLTDGTENFGFDTIKMKENNLRVKFDDTSTTAGFPANDWELTANDSSSGGANRFSILDVTGSKTPFTVTAGAATGSLFVSSTGKVGLGTTTPVLKLSLKLGDTPAARFEQDASSGWTAQTWDVAGNESNFFVRDVTGGSKLPLRIQPGTPTNTVTLKSDGRVGIGTWSPAYPLELETTGQNAAFVAERTDGASIFVSATASYAQFGSVSNHPTRILVNSAWKLMANTDGSLSMANGASCTAGGVWTNASSAALKENIAGLSDGEALAALAGLRPVKFNYKAAAAEKHVGFIAEEVPDLLASADRKTLSPMDIVAVLTKVVQEQQKTIDTLQRRLDALEHEK